MRIRFGTWIHECTMVSNPGNGNVINARTNNGLYTITFESKEEANGAYHQLLLYGWFDATNYEYTN